MTGLGTGAAAPADPVTDITAGIALSTAPDSGERLDDLIVPGLRHNRRRAHLLVSTVLGKHIPARPVDVRGAADRLGDAVQAAVGVGVPVAAVGFAETATGLGHCVAHRITADVYLHSTRRPGSHVAGTFEEGHSHATTHLLRPADPSLLTARDPDTPLVLVDDEISTGSTALAAIRALHHRYPRRRYVVASLVDMRTAEHRAATDRAARDLGVRVDHVSLAQGRIALPDGLIDAAAALNPAPSNPVGDVRGQVRIRHVDWPAGVPDGGRHGFRAADTAAFERAVGDIADRVTADLFPGRPVVVVGHEELMYLPLLLAEHVDRAGWPTRFQTTTRSPAHICDVAGYPLRRGFSFAAPEPDPATRAPRFLYNVRTPGEDMPQVVLVVDAPADTAALRAEGGLLDVLNAAGHDVLAVVVPAADPSAITARRETDG